MPKGEHDPAIGRNLGGLRDLVGVGAAPRGRTGLFFSPPWQWWAPGGGQPQSGVVGGAGLSVPDLALVLLPLGSCCLLAGYENLTAPLFALARQCKLEVTVPASGSSP
jgi:hypothetical protein